jgi:hypothetical protein
MRAVFRTIRGERVGAIQRRQDEIAVAIAKLSARGRSGGDRVAMLHDVRTLDGATQPIRKDDELERRDRAMRRSIQRPHNDRAHEHEQHRRRTENHRQPPHRPAVDLGPMRDAAGHTSSARQSDDRQRQRP